MELQCNSRKHTRVYEVVGPFEVNLYQFQFQSVVMSSQGEVFGSCPRLPKHSESTATWFLSNAFVAYLLCFSRGPFIIITSKTLCSFFFLLDFLLELSRSSPLVSVIPTTFHYTLHVNRLGRLSHLYSWQGQSSFPFIQSFYTAKPLEPRFYGLFVTDCNTPPSFAKFLPSSSYLHQ